MKKPYAHNTTAKVVNSRAEIDRLLRQWDCDGIQWTDEIREGKVILRFRWMFEDVSYQARMSVKLPADAVFRRESRHRLSDGDLDKKKAQRWRSLHRVLLIAIKSQLNAVDAGLLTAVEAFLPYLEVSDGRTVAEVAIPRLREIGTEGGAMRLLEMK